MGHQMDSSARSDRRCSISLVWIIAVAMAAVLAGTASVTAVLSDISATDAIHSLAELYVRAVMKNVQDSTSQIMGRGDYVVKALTRQLTYDDTSAESLAFITRSVIDLAAGYDGPLDKVYYGDELDNATFATVWNSTDPSTYQFLVSRSNKSNPVFVPGLDCTYPSQVFPPLSRARPNLTNWGIMSDPTLVMKPCQRANTWRPTIRPWYKLIRDTYRTNTAMTDPYLFASAPKLGVTVCRGAWTSTGRFAGVAAVDFTLDGLSAMLSSVVVPKDTLLVLVDQKSSSIIAANSPTPFVITNSAGQKVPLNTTTWPEPRMQALAAMGSDILFADASLRWLSVGGSSQVVSTTHFTTSMDNVQWSIVMMVPESVVMDAVIKNRPTLIGATAGVIIGGIVICAVLSYMLLRPLSELCEDMQNIADMALDEITEKTSRISEVLMMYRSLLTIVQNLKMYKAYMPASLFAEEDEEEEELVAGSVNLGSVNLQASTKVEKLMSDGSASGKFSSPSAKASSRGSRASVSVRVTAAAKQRLAEQGTLTAKPITVVFVNVRGFHDLCDAQAKSSKSVTDQHATYLDTVLKHAKDTRGVPDTFQGDRVMLTWNAVTPCATHAVQSARFAVRLGAESCPGMRLAQGIASGFVLCGNIGAATMKKFTCFGGIVNVAHLMVRLAPKLSASILSRYVSSSDVINNFITRLVPFKIRFDKVTKDGPFGLIEILSEKKVSEDEWMYQLEEGQKADPFAKVNAAIVKALDGTWDTARTLLQEAERATATFNDEKLKSHLMVVNEVFATGTVTELGSESFSVLC